MTFKRYLVDSVLEINAEIARIGFDESGGFVCLSETVFHPRGGGQDFDRGFIHGQRVLKVAVIEDEVRHYLEQTDKFEVGQNILLSVDPVWRNTCSKYHTAGHLIAALVEEKFPTMRAVGGHHWVGEARVEFSSKETIGTTGLQTLINQEILRTIALDLAIVIGFDDKRTIQIGNYPSVGCGGTHVTSLSHLLGLEVSKVKVKDGKVRVSYHITT